MCAVNEQGAARKSVYPSGNRHGDAKKSRCSQQPNRSLRCLTNRACARSVAAQSHNTPEEITSCSRRKWIAAIASTHDLSDGNPETVALHRPHRGSVAVGTSHSRRMQSSGPTSGPTSRDLRHDNSFRIAAIDLDQGLVAYPARSGANHRSFGCSLSLPACCLDTSSATLRHPTVMHVEDARRFCDVGQFEHAGFAERDLGVVVRRR